MGGAYPYIDLNAKYEKLSYDVLLRKLKYSLNENFNLLPYIEWDRFVTLTGAQAE
jgi:hypothetical protein